MKPIKNKKTILRPFQKKDVIEYVRYRSDREWLGFQNAGVPTKEKALAFFKEMNDREFGKRGEWKQLAIADIKTRKIIGDLGLKPELYDYRVVEIGISIKKEFAGKGYASDAMRGIINYLFTEKNIHRIIGIAHTRNKNSIQLFKKLGFRKEARFKKSYCINGVWEDEYLYALLNEEWNHF